MKNPIYRLSSIALAAISLTSILNARPDTLAEYDENALNTATISSFYTNHPSGYSGFVADIFAAWNAEEGGVIDEFSPSGLYTSFNSQPFITGYGPNGYYDPVNATSTGPTITLNVDNNDWDLATNGGNAEPAISLDYYLVIAAASQNQKITMVTSSGAQVRQLGYTILANNLTTVTAQAYFSDGTDYTESIDIARQGSSFFGAVAPTGAFIEYFTIGTADGSKVSIDDIAFSTAEPVPECSTFCFVFLGAAFLVKRRRVMA
jgi:hypothetical protein